MFPKERGLEYTNLMDHC